MERTVNDLEKTAIFDREVTIPDLRAEIAGLRASKAKLSEEGTKLRFEIADLKARIARLCTSNDRLSDEGTRLQLEIAELRKENERLKDRNSTYLMRLKHEEQNREGWQGRAHQAEAELALR